MVGLVVLTFFASGFLSSTMVDKPVVEPFETTLRHVEKKVEPIVPKTIEIPEVQRKAPAQRQQLYTRIEITPDRLVSKDSKIETLEDDAGIGAVKIDVGGAPKIVLAPIKELGTDLVSVPVTKPKEDSTFLAVEIDAEYPGGKKNWVRFLERNLRTEFLQESNLERGTYTVVVQFVVSKDGSLSDIKSVTSLGHGLESEAEKAIAASGRWKPAIQNGREVKAFRRQSISFQIL